MSKMCYGKIWLFDVKTRKPKKVSRDIWWNKKIGGIKLYGVTDWKNLSKEIYKNQLKMNSEFETSFESLAYMINHLFGNEAIIALIKNTYGNQELEKDILKFKKEIREKYSENNKIYVLMNLSKIKEINTDDTKTSEILLKDKSR